MELLTIDREEEEEEEEEEDVVCGNGGGPGEKKRRLAAEQVRALERSFEVDNKLDPERKSRIARDLRLHPRQVAVWFQNRRARWKTKQMERDFTALRSRHDALRHECDALRRDKDALAAEVTELRHKDGSSVTDSDSNAEAPSPYSVFLANSMSGLQDELFAVQEQTAAGLSSSYGW